MTYVYFIGDDIAVLYSLNLREPLTFAPDLESPFAVDNHISFLGHTKFMVYRQLRGEKCFTHSAIFGFRREAIPFQLRS